MDTLSLSEIIAAAGGVPKLAAIAGCSHQAVYRWRQVPAERVIRVAAALDIPRERIRPDIYPPDDRSAA